MACSHSAETSGAGATMGHPEVARVLGDARFERAMAHLAQEHPRIIEDALILQQISAPYRCEAEKARRFRDMLQDHGLVDVDIDAEGNVLGTRKGRAGSSGLVAIVSHLDTVFPEGTPLAPRRQGSRIYAPGLADNSWALAVNLALMRAMDAADLRHMHDILFVGSVGEEGLGNLRGVKYLFDDGQYRHRITAVLTHDGLVPHRIINGGVGSRRYRVTFRGPGGHSFNAFGLVNPAYALAGAIARFATLEVPSGSTYNVGQIGGGTSVNAIPLDAWMEVDLRSSDIDTLAAMDASLRKATSEAVAEENCVRSPAHDAITCNLDLIGDRPSGVTDPEHEIVRIAMAALASQGWEPSLVFASTDSNVPIAKGIPAIAMSGCIGGGEHSLQEFVDTEPEANLRLVAAKLATIVVLAGLA